MKFMLKTLTSAEMDEGKDISLLFSTLSEESKTMGVIYLSALRDKELADSAKEDMGNGRTENRQEHKRAGN